MRSDEKRLGTLKVRRGNDYGAFARSVKLHIDGVHRASLKPGEEIAFDVMPGHHRLRASLDWIRSRELKLEVRNEEPLSVEMSVPADAYWKTWLKPSQALEIKVVT